MDLDPEMASAIGFSSSGTQPQSHSRKRQKISALDTGTPQSGNAVNSKDHRNDGHPKVADEAVTGRANGAAELHLGDQAADDEYNPGSSLKDEHGDQENSHEAQEQSFDQSRGAETIKPSSSSSMAITSNPTMAPSTAQGSMSNQNLLPNRPRQTGHNNHHPHHHHQNNNRNGVWQGDEGGYYDGSFIEDPWQALRASK